MKSKISLFLFASFLRLETSFSDASITCINEGRFLCKLEGKHGQAMCISNGTTNNGLIKAFVSTLDGEVQVIACRHDYRGP